MIIPEYLDPATSRQPFRDHTIIVADKLVMGYTGRGKNPKKWEAVVLDLSHVVPVHCGYVSQGGGFRYGGFYVAHVWRHLSGVDITAAFFTESEAIEFMIDNCRRYCS
ncbi:MAG: hypothetical protein ABW128_17005 [Rhizorhabdus sp.]